MKAFRLSGIVVVFLAALQLDVLVFAEENMNHECAFQYGLPGSDAKDLQLERFTIIDAGTQETTNYGVRINNSESLKAGLRGPTLMEDFMMREKIMHFGKSISKNCMVFN